MRPDDEKSGGRVHLRIGDPVVTLLLIPFDADIQGESRRGKPDELEPVRCSREGRDAIIRAVEFRGTRETCRVKIGSVLGVIAE